MKNKKNKQKYTHTTNKENPIKFSYSRSKRLRYGMLCCFLILLLLCGRIGFLQFVQGDELKAKMYRQLATSDTISAKRGSIYDTNGKALALSAQVDTVSIEPNSIKVTHKDPVIATEKTTALKEKVAKGLSEIFELDYEETYQKVCSTNRTETIAKKVENDKIEQLKAWMKENDTYAGITITEDSKRYYPYNNLASNLIGFCGTDNQGLEGLEKYWDSILTGTPGKIVTTQDAMQEFIPDKNEKYIAAENGSDVTLTIDVTIQSIVEKYLKQAVIEGDCARGGNAIVMNPKTGDILAMATYPDFDCNTPFAPIDGTNWDEMSSSEKSTAWQKRWNNRAVTDTYEPGSTFKIITSSIALEENLVMSDVANDFLCPGYEDISGTKIYCWKTSGHGSETLRNALMNSCNPAMMQLAKRIGVSTLYKYFDAFGFFGKTGIATSGETKGYFWDIEDVGPVELATMSFGQRFKITPLQLATAVSSVANNGTMMKPRIVKELKNRDTNTVTVIDPEEVCSVISEKTANTMLDMLESVVSDGTGRYGQVQGYTIAGKTGTSEPSPGAEEDGYVASYVAIAPAEDPELVVLVALYAPKGESHQGGALAGPVVSQILSEVLPYLGIPSNTDASASTEDRITVPDIRNKTVSEAKKVLENAGFTVEVSGNLDQLVADQTPKPGTSLLPNSIIKIYGVGNDARVSVTVPNLKGMTLSQAKNALSSKKLNIHFSGTGKVLNQDPIADVSVEEGSIVTVTLKEELQDAH